MTKKNENTIKNLLLLTHFTPASDEDIDGLLSGFLALHDWEKTRHAEVSIVHVNLDSNFMFYGLTDEEIDHKIAYDDEVERYPLSGYDVFNILSKYQLMQQLDKLHINYFGVLEKGNAVWEFFVLFICAPGKRTHDEYATILKSFSRHDNFKDRQYDSFYKEEFVYEHSNSNSPSIENRELNSMIIKKFYEKMNELSVHGDQANDKRFIKCHLNKQLTFRELISEQLAC